MTDQLLSVEQVAEILKVEPRTLRVWIRENRSPVSFTRVGGRLLRARASDLEAWLSGLGDGDKGKRPPEVP